MASGAIDSKETQGNGLYELIRESLELKRAFNTEYLKKIASHVPSELTESHSLMYAGDLPSTENEELQKKVDNLQKRINELEVSNDNLRLKMGVDEATLLDDSSEKKDEFNLSPEQLKMQRDLLRTELAKSLEHKKKTDQYSMEAKQHAQRLTAENEQLKESLKRVTSEKEQMEATYRNASQHHREQYSSSIEPSSEKTSEFDKQIDQLMKDARVDLVKEEVARQVAEKMKEEIKKQSRISTEPVRSLTAQASMESEITAMVDLTASVDVEENDLDVILNSSVPLIMCSLMIIGLPGSPKTNFIKNLFDLYSIDYEPNWEDKDIVLTKIDVMRDTTGKIRWEKCQGNDCDVLRLILHRVCAENEISVDHALDELAAIDGKSPLSESHVNLFRAMLDKLKNSASTSDNEVEMYGMSQVFDFSHKSTAFAQIPVLFTDDKKKIITIFVCGEESTMYCPRANGIVSLADGVMFWANYLGHFKPDAYSMIVAFNGSASAANALLSDLTSKTKEIGVRNIFPGLIFEIGEKSGMISLQAQLNKAFINAEKKVKLSWLIFHSALIKIAEWPWIPYKVVKQLASIFRIGKVELSEVMQFWSSITSVLYRDVDLLRDIVFCDTVWLAKELSKVLNLEPALNNLLQYGVVEQCVADKHWLKISSSEGKTTLAGPHQLLLDYFIDFKLATIISVVEGKLEGKQHLQCNCYFIPSLLKPCRDILTKNKDSLFVQFPQSFMPMQIFSRIVIHLLRDKYLGCGLNKTYLYSNKVSLHIDSCCDLLLVEHRFSIEIIYDCSYCLRPKEEVVKIIRDNIEECSNELSLAFSFQLMCPNDVHYIRVPDVKAHRVHCQKCASHVTLSNNQLYWVVEHLNLPAKSKDSSSSTIPELTTDHLVKIAEKINARDANRLALELGFFDAEFELIRSFGHKKRVVLYVLITWFDRNEQIKHKHMSLDRALIATGYGTLAVASTDIHVEQRNPIEDSELRLLAEHVNRDWKTLALFCNVELEDIMMEQWDTDVDAAYLLLQKWNQSYTGTNPRKQLVEHIHRLGLLLVAHNLEQGTLNFYKATANRQFL